MPESQNDSQVDTQIDFSGTAPCETPTRKAKMNAKMLAKYQRSKCSICNKWMTRYYLEKHVRKVHGEHALQFVQSPAKLRPRCSGLGPIKCQLKFPGVPKDATPPQYHGDWSILTNMKGGYWRAYRLGSRNGKTHSKRDQRSFSWRAKGKNPEEARAKVCEMCST